MTANFTFVFANLNQGIAVTQVKKMKVNSKRSAAKGNEQTTLGTHLENLAVINLGVVPKNESKKIYSCSLSANVCDSLFFVHLVQTPKPKPKPVARKAIANRGKGRGSRGAKVESEDEPFRSSVSVKKIKVRFCKSIFVYINTYVHYFTYLRIFIFLASQTS